MSRRVGDRIGRYEILAYLGQGGCGVVYKARHDGGRVVALKVLASAEPLTVAHFLREVKLTPEHDNIRRVHCDGEEADGTRWIEMEYLDGESLGQRLKRGPLTWREILALGTQVCAALETTHELGIIHRDLKPDNIFFEERTSRARVVDFSIALLQSAERLTATGTILGTYAYMSPEQIRGDRELDARSDLWSLGMVLYECAAGRGPFRSPTVAGLVYNIMFMAPELVLRHRADTPPRFAEILHRTLSKDPAERFPSARALRDALASLDARALESPASTAVQRVENRPPSVAHAERALMSLVFLRGVADTAALTELARSYGGELVPFAGARAIARFGGASFRGDEPERAVRLAGAALPFVEAVGVATGWTLTPDRVEGGDLASRAEQLAVGARVALDPSTAVAVRERVTLTKRADGSAELTDEQANELASVGAVALHSAGPERSPEVVAFFGRAPHLEALIECAASTPRDGVSAAVVHGDPGMGKTRLMWEAISRMQRDMPRTTALTCRCTSYRKDTPLGAWQELLASTLCEVDLHALPRRTSLTAEVLFDQAAAAVEKSLRALAARGPVVVAIDDAHWLDALSSKLVEWIVENAAELPLAFWLLGRPERWDAPVCLPQGTSTITLGPLDLEDAERLLVKTFGEAHRSVLERAGGNPLFLKELARLSTQSEGGSDLADANVVDMVFGARLARFDPPQKEFLKRAAVLGCVGWIEAVQSMDGDPAAWRRLLAERALQRSPRSSIADAQEFAFSNGLMAEVAYRLWPTLMLPSVHAAAARWLGSHPDASPGELGRHWEAARRPNEAAEAYVRAAELAARVGDVERAIDQCGRVMDLSRDPSLRWRALAARDAAFQLFAHREQQDIQEQGLTLMSRLALELTLRHSTETAWRQCYFYRITGDRALATAFGVQAIALAPALDDPSDVHRWASASHNELALLNTDTGAFEVALEHAREAHRHASQLDDPWWLARTCFSEGYAIVELDRVEEALTLFDVAAEGYARAGDRRREATARLNGGFVLMRLGRFEGAEARLEEAVTLSRTVGNRRTVAVASLNRSTLLRLRGELDAATVLLDEAERAALDLRFGRLRVAVMLERTSLAIARGHSADEIALLAHAAYMGADDVGSPALIAQAQVTRLLATDRADVRKLPLEAEARTWLMEERFSHEGSAALAIALHVLTVDGKDAETAVAHLRAFVERAVPRGDRRACVASLALRYGLPLPLTERLAEEVAHGGRDDRSE